MNEKTYTQADPAIVNEHGGVVCTGCEGCHVKDKYQRHPREVYRGALSGCPRLKNGTQPADGQERRR